MNIILLQGSDELKIRQRLAELKSKAKAKGFSIRYLPTPSLESLFETKTLFILDSNTKLSRTDLRQFNHKKYYLIAVTPSASEIKLLSEIDQKPKVERFDLPKTIFNFLESFYPHNTAACLKLFHNSLLNMPAEYVFNLLSHHLINLYWVITDPDTLTQASWKIAKLKQQAEKFKHQDIKDIIQQMAQIDVSVKTSKLDLIPALDLLIIRQLK